VRAEAALRKVLPHATVVRGDTYFSQGRVRRIEKTEDGVIEAEVQGKSLYNVRLAIDGVEVGVRCTCPWFSGHLEECKHIWATIRAAGARSWLPEHELYPVVDEDLRPATPQFRTPQWRDQRPAWQRFLESLGPAHPAREPGPRSIPEEIAYVVVPFAHARTLSLHLLGRTRRKNGDWGRWKPVSLYLDDLESLPPFDRETLAVLHSRSYDTRIEPMVHIASTSTAWWTERLARAGRLAFRSGEDDPRPIAWDDGPPWKLRVAVVNDAASALYRIEASVEREGESMPLERIDAIINDVLFSNDRAYRFDDAGRASWLQPLRASGPIEVPYADTDRFRQALLRAPMANVALPEELGWTVVDAKPRPVLSLMHDGWSSELQAELRFDYDEWRVSSRSAENQKTIGRKLIHRDRAAEAKLGDRLVSLHAIAAWPGYRIRLPHLEELARTLVGEGWTLEIDNAPVRVANELDVEISSGIDWFDLNIHANFGDVRVALPELLASAEAKRSLLRLSDGSYGIVPGSWAEDLAPIAELGKAEGDSLRFRPAQALLIDAMLESKAKADRAFSELRERLVAAAPAPRMEPPTLATTLRPYQRAGLGWFHFLRDTGFGGVLADDMGLGKTVQALALLEELRAAGNTRPSLVVAPRSLLFNWIAEARRWAPGLRVIEHHGAARAANQLTDCDIVLTTYATMRLDIDRLAEIEFEYAILDEAQAIKNATSAAAKASRRLKARHRLALSGTPIENHLGELWSLFEFLNPGLLGSARSFSRTFASKTALPERREALSRALRPLILRRTKEQVAPELPERIEQTLYCELEGKQKKQYEELRDHYRQSLLGGIKKNGIEKSRMKILEALLRLRQAACDPALIDPASDASSAKMELLMDELHEVLDSGHRALVFSQFTSFLKIVRDALDKERVDYLYLDGKTRDRQSLVERFQSSDGPPLFLISLKAGGLGLNLTNADYIFLLDPWWNPAVEAQAIDRAHRIGRQKPVVAYRLIARDTVEEKILELQARKREIAESIISEDNSVLRKLEVEDLELLLG
jgi:superfamily II DNA or RNA helicase